MRIRKELEAVSLRDLKYFMDRDKSDIPVKYFQKLKTDITENGLLRPIKVHAFVEKTSANVFSVVRRIVQDGFVRWEIFKELGLTEIECESHFFTPDMDLTIGYKPVIKKFEEIVYSGDTTQFTDPHLPPETEFDEETEGISYVEVKETHETLIQAFKELVTSIQTDGQPRSVNCYCRVTEDEDAHWLYGEITSQDDKLLVACEKAGLIEVEVNLRLIDMREGRS